jgi:hypothetical protein
VASPSHSKKAKTVEFLKIFRKKEKVNWAKVQDVTRLFQRNKLLKLLNISYNYLPIQIQKNFPKGQNKTGDQLPSTSFSAYNAKLA